MATIHMSEFEKIGAWGQYGKPDVIQVAQNIGAAAEFAAATTRPNVRIVPRADCHIRFEVPGDPVLPAALTDEFFPAGAEIGRLFPLGTKVKHIAAV